MYFILSQLYLLNQFVFCVAHSITSGIIYLFAYVVLLETKKKGGG